MSTVNQNALPIDRSELWGHPKGLYILFFTELWERFSYYGMRAILVLYIISSAADQNAGLGWAEGRALALYGWYTMLVYVMSIPGGIIADKWLGQKKTVLLGGLTLCAGHGILAVDAPWAFFTGLALIIIGVGGLKPNISTMVGGLYKPGDERRDSGFTIFYIGINVGAFLSSLIVGYVGEKIGWHYGFGLAGIGMLLGQVVYMMGQKYLRGVGEAPGSDPHPDESIIHADRAEDTSLGELFRRLFRSPVQLAITAVLLIGGILMGLFLFEGFDRWAYAALFAFLAITAGMLMMIYKDVDSKDKDRLVVLLLSFIIVIVFWGAFEQAGGLMNIYTKQKIDRFVSISVLDILFYAGTALLLIRGVIGTLRKEDTQVLYYVIGALLGIGYTVLRYLELTDPYLIPASVFQSVNALFIIIFGTIVAGFWLWWKHRGKESSSLFKMATGTIIMGAGFIFMAMATKQADDFVGAKGMLILLILAYFFHTIGELCASPVALSFITKLAPVKYVSIMMGLYFAATGLGNKVAGAIGEAAQAEPVKVELTASRDQMLAYVPDSIINKSQNFQIVADVKIENGQVILMKDGTDFNRFIEWKDGGREELTGRAVKAEEPELTAILDFEREKEMKEKAPGTTAGYTAQVQIFELQNQREYWTFLSIFLLTAVFGLLLLAFLRKLKKLTHGAEEKEGTSHEEHEPYEISDIQDKDKKNPGEI
ncbi:MAG: peptide MFS transporter [Bacteroidia bacterium]